MSAPSVLTQNLQHRAESAQAPRGVDSPGKVAYIMSRFPKITETFILYEILALEELGIPVEIYPLLREYQAVTHPEAERLVQRAHFHPFISLPILHAQWHFIRRRPLAYLRLWAEVLAGTWGSTNFFVGALGILPKAVRFAYEMERQGVTHVHAHFASHPAVAALIIHRLTGIPFSFTAHGSDLHVERRMLDKKVAAAAFAVTISSYNREVMVQECGEAARDKIHVIHCGVDPTIFSLPSGKKEKGRFEILCVASFEEVKGHKFLVEACRLLRERNINFGCHLVGEGPLRSQIETEIARSSLQDRICLHGAQPRNQIARMLSEADALALASVPTRNGKREGIPVVLMEAMSSGLPVVATNISGIPELVSSGSTGLLVSPADAVELADALEKLANEAELRDRLGRAGREKVLRDFNLRTNARTLVEFFFRNKPSVEMPANPNGGLETAAGS